MELSSKHWWGSGLLRLRLLWLYLGLLPILLRLTLREELLGSLKIILKPKIIWSMKIQRMVCIIWKLRSVVQVIVIVVIILRPHLILTVKWNASIIEWVVRWSSYLRVGRETSK